MHTKPKIAFLTGLAVTLIFLSCFMEQASAEIYAYARTDRGKYLEGEVISTEITLEVTQPITIDEYNLQRIFSERHLDVRNPDKKKLLHAYYQTNVGEDDPNPEAPDAPKIVLQPDKYKVYLEDLREHFDIDILGPYSFRFVLSLTTYDASGIPTDRTISSKIDKFEIVGTIFVDIDPNTLNKKSKGRAITAYLSAFPIGYTANNVIPSEVKLVYGGETLNAFMWNTQHDVLMVKFDRAAAQDMLPVGDEVEVNILGKFDSGVTFTASDTIRVIDRGKKK